MSAAASPIINVDQLAFERERVHGDRFHGWYAEVARNIGAKKLGYNVTRLAAGMSASPFHSHHVAEEMFFILEGRGTLRFGSRRMPVRQGDFVACPPGGPEVAHQLVADADAELTFIAVGTRPETDVWVYPDSGKWGAVAGRDWSTAAEGPPRAAFEARYVADGSEIDYWAGE